MPVARKAPAVKPSERLRLRVAASRAGELAKVEKYRYKIQPPELPPGVVPKDKTAPVMAMDYQQAEFNPYAFGGITNYWTGFPGYPYLAQLSTRAEYRAFADTLSTEITREWIEFSSKDKGEPDPLAASAGAPVIDSADKIAVIEEELIRLKVRETFNMAVQQDSYFGRAQLFINISGADRSLPLVVSPQTIPMNSLLGVKAVEAIWTTPSAYNATDPARDDFYRPSTWFMLGQQVDQSRLLTIITRPVPDILKPAFNFGGMSMSQLAEPYVDNWLRTRQSVSDLISNFSTTVLMTNMDQILQGVGGPAIDDFFSRIELFTATKSNRGVMALNKDTEELGQINTPLSGLDALQAQAQEHMCSVSRTPAIILTGISPSGLNASSDGEIRVFYDWIAAQQNAFWRPPLQTIIEIIQLSKFGEVDPDITFDFVPLYQMTPKELAEIRKSDGDADCAYVDKGILDPTEVRERLARDPTSGYDGLDTSVVPAPPPPPAPGLMPGEDPPGGLPKPGESP